jgi:soluble lytic murein transglycosylase
LYARKGESGNCLAALARAPVPEGLEPWAAVLEAEAALALGRWDAAQAAIARARPEDLPLEMRQRLLVVRGFVAQHRGDATSIDALAPELGDAARRDDRTGLLLFDLARAARRTGDSARARGWLVELLEARPTPAESAYALLLQPRDAQALEVTETALAVGRFEIRTARHPAARERLRGAATRAPSSSARAEILLALADSYLRAGEYDSCLETLTRAARATRGTRFEPERLRLRARAERRSGRPAAAIVTYRELARRFPSHAIADDALYEVGWLREAKKSFAEAEAAYLRCRRRYPNGPLADDCALRAGLCALRAGRASDAAVHLRSLSNRQSRSSLLDNALYWQLVAQLERGDSAGALELRDRLAREFPLSYFTVLAQRRVERGLASSAESAAEPSANPGAPGSEPLAGLARGARAEAAAADAIATLRGAGLRIPADFDVRIRPWRFLLDAGLGAEALWESRRLERLYEAEPGALVEMIAIATPRGAHERLVRWAYLLGLRLRDPQYQEAIQVLLYPAPFAPALAEAAGRYGLSHAAVLGLMRQESAFDPAIDSAAGARGLMQLMPEVGRRLWPAERGAYHPDALYEPDINIELGCRLLQIELGRAAGDLSQALAAYNAGGDAAENWTRRLRPNDPPEMYVDLVEYSETRNYLKTVLGNIETYRRLYALP